MLGRRYTAYRTEVQTAAEELMGKASISIEPAPVLSGTLGAALVAAAAKNYMSGVNCCAVALAGLCESRRFDSAASL